MNEIVYLNNNESYNSTINARISFMPFRAGFTIDGAATFCCAYMLPPPKWVSPPVRPPPMI